MAKIQETFNFGNAEDLEILDVLELLGRMYTDLAQAINRKPDFYEREKDDGQTTDVTLSNGDLNLNASTKKVEMLVKHIDSATVAWKTL